MKTSLHIIKIGGNIIDDADKLTQFLSLLGEIKVPFILVHGGGKTASEVGERLGVKARKIDGRRITDKETLDVVLMVYGGLVNKTIVAQLQKNNINSIGLSGADGNVIKAHKRPVRDGVDFGYVGDIDEVKGENLKNLLHAGFIPVMAPLTHDCKGQMLNTNADTIASSVAIAMSDFYDVKLIYCFELPGVMEDINDPGSVISEINHEKYKKLKQQGIIADGMIPKMDNAYNAIENGVSSVVITEAFSVKKVLDSQTKTGTTLTWK